MIEKKTKNKSEQDLVKNIQNEYQCVPKLLIYFHP